MGHTAARLRCGSNERPDFALRPRVKTIDWVKWYSACQTKRRPSRTHTGQFSERPRRARKAIRIRDVFCSGRSSKEIILFRIVLFGVFISALHLHGAISVDARHIAKKNRQAILANW